MANGSVHAKYSASGTHRWFKCPASIRMCAAVPNREDSDYALDGTEAHSLLAYALENKIWSAEDALMLSGMEWTHRTDDEVGRLGSVDTALDTVRELLDTWGEGALLFVETQFKIPCEAAPDEAFGTADIVIVIPVLDMMYVIDLKNGAGITVHADQNTQLLSYGIGVRSVLPFTITSVCLMIIQPRAFHPKGIIREFWTDDKRLDEFVIEFNEAVLRAQDPEAPFVPAPSTCRFCDGKLACPAYEAVALNVIPMPDVRSFMDIEERKLPDVQGMPIEKLAYIMQNKDMLYGFLKACEKAAYAYAMSGKQFPGFKLVEPMSRRKFNSTDEKMARQLMSLMQIDDLDAVYPRTLIGIGEAEALLKKAFRKEGVKPKQMDHAIKMAFANLTTKDNLGGKFTLAPVEDARPAATGRSVGAVFATVRASATDIEEVKT